jgi:hypothetical protein
MLTVLSLVTSVKDYIEIAHKLIESQNGNFLFPQPFIDITQKETGLFLFNDYTEFGAVLTYLVLSLKQFLASVLSFEWLKQIWNIPLIVPDIAAAMISEVSVLDSYFTNAFSFIETGLNSSGINPTLGLPTSENTLLFAFEKFMTGLINSLFFVLPTSTAHLITIRRFVIQGLEAGYIAGLGTIAGNFLWLASIILGWRFIVIPWLSFDIFRYILGFSLLVKYLWDSSKELNQTNKLVLEENSKQKQNIFLLNFLLALTEQTSIYPFISNISFGSEGSIFESLSGTIFQSYASNAHSFEFFAIHGSYLLGILFGCLSLLQFSVWFWEKPAFSIYMWMITSYRVSTSSYYKVLNFIFLYLTMLCAISSIPYFGLDYTITNPLGLIPQDRIIDQRLTTTNGSSDQVVKETAFLGLTSTDKNSRIRDGMHPRRERWKERLIKYQAFDTSLYDQGTYDILTIEDLNYGFERFWLRRKLRNHQIRLRLLPGPWMRTLKKQLNKPGFSGPRVEFFRILFEQYYHPSFGSGVLQNKTSIQNTTTNPTLLRKNNFVKESDVISEKQNTLNNVVLEQSKSVDKWTNSGSILTPYKKATLRKFSRNFQNRLNGSLIPNFDKSSFNNPLAKTTSGSKPIYSKSLKYLFAKIAKEYPQDQINLFRNISRNILSTPSRNSSNKLAAFNSYGVKEPQGFNGLKESLKKTNIRKKLSKKERLLLTYKMDFYKNVESLNSTIATTKQDNVNNGMGHSFGLGSFVAPIGAQPKSLEPLQYYLRKDDALKRKFKYYSTAVVRNLSVGNNAPYFKTIFKRAFYYHKPSLRWKRTIFTAAMRRGFRKKSNLPKKLVYTSNSTTFDPSSKLELGAVNNDINSVQSLNSPLFAKTSSYSILGKRASRYRYQIYKDVLQHWYYSPFNRLLLKFDIDSFINRQPKSQFVTKKEERLLHLRRMLLSEHYNSLRWYTYMQHYRTMKSSIGSTKSFSSTLYNQQFLGTFKKIRHLFSITPIQGDMPVLKFDQVLYNSSNLNSKLVLLNNNLNNPAEAQKESSSLSGINYKQGKEKPKPMVYLHEESTAYGNIDPNTKTENSKQNNSRLDILPEDLISKSVNLAGALITSDFQTENTLQNSRFSSTLSTDSTLEAPKETKEILLRLLKECKRRLNDQVFIKNYISHRLDKRELRNNEVQGELQKNLELFQSWLSPIAMQQKDGLNKDSYALSQKEPLLMQTTGVRKALNEGVLILNNINPAVSSKTLFKTEIADSKFTNYGNSNNNSYIDSLAILQKEEKIKQTLKSIKAFSKQDGFENSSQNKGGESKTTKQKSLLTSNLLKPLLLTIRNTTNLLITKTQLVATKAQKNLKWKFVDFSAGLTPSGLVAKKQRVISKRRASRKKARLKNIKANIEEKAKNSQTRLRLNSSLFAYASQQEMDYSSSVSAGQGDKLTPFGRKLRKKQESQESSKSALVDVVADNQNKDKKSTVWSYGFETQKKVGNYFKNLVIKKFNAKRSSKGSRYRNMSMNRGFAYVRKPKNIFYGQNQTTLFDNSLNTQNEFLSKDDKTLLFQKFKQKLANNPSNLAATTDGTNFYLTDSSKMLNYQPPVGESEKAQGSQIQNLLVQTTIKKSPLQKRSKRTWKKRKRQKFTRNHNKYRKHDIYGFGKLRNLNKKYKRIMAIEELQNWWWNIYLPKYLSTTTKGQETSSIVKTTKKEGLAYKPLSTSKALEIRGNLYQKDFVSNSTESTTKKGLDTPNSTNLMLFEDSTNKIQSDISNSSNSLGIMAGKTVLSDNPNGLDNSSILDQIYSSTFNSKPEQQKDTTPNRGLPFVDSKQINNTTNIPFYAGWDESLRKFVVTNRLLSRRDAGFRQEVVADQENNQKSILDFTKAPIKGLNEASFLYLQNEMPFNSYVLDQFIPNNQSFYAPLGWKRFQFRHTLLKNWVQVISKDSNHIIQSSTNKDTPSQSKKTVFLKQSLLNNLDSSNGRLLPNNNRNTQILINKRIKKRYKLLKQTPIQLMYVPTGALLNEILPSHYVSVFDKQYRSPRNLYLKRYLPKENRNQSDSSSKKLASLQNSKSTNNIEDLTILEYSNSFQNNKMLQSPLEFTLRKKIKPRRKYHKKRFTKKDDSIFPRRYKFRAEVPTSNQSQANGEELLIPSGENATTDFFRLRPSTKAKQGSSAAAQKTKTKNRLPRALRLRQLRNREFKQVYKPLQRFQPRSGGFVWPGDYLRFEIIPMPKLSAGNIATTEIEAKSASQASTFQNKVKLAKQKIAVQPIGLLPRKYLLEKHNLKVVKKKLYLRGL